MEAIVKEAKAKTATTTTKMAKMAKMATMATVMRTKILMIPKPRFQATNQR